MRRVMLGASLVLLGLIALQLARAALARYPVYPIEVVADPAVWRGAWHVHTVRSDGQGTLEEVAAAAKRAGSQWVVLADHNFLEPGGPRYVDGVLVVPSTEVSSPAGHVVGFGVERGLTDDERQNTPLEAIASLGGKPVAAHPLNRRRPYDALSRPELVGMEILSADDLFREALVSPETLIPAALAYPINQQFAAMGLLHRPEANLAKWDELLRTRRLAGFCSIDAHGWPDYEVMMRTVAMYARVGRAPAGEAAADARALVDALAGGRSHCGIDALAPAGAFRFFANGEGRRWEIGDEPLAAEVTGLEVELAWPSEDAPFVSAALRCGGVRVDPFPPRRPIPGGGADGEERKRFRFRSPASASACRAEVSLGEGEGGGNWILSNPIYLR